MVSFEDAEAAGYELVADVLASVQATQLGADGSATVHLVVPSQWVQAAVEVHRASRGSVGMVYLRAYAMPPVGAYRTAVE